MEGVASSIQILSRQIIKPSTPPPHNTKLKLSYLDHLMPHMYIPLIFFYQPNHAQSTHSQISHHLKQSLSNTLTSFYPLAGTFHVQDPSLIDCNHDAGGIEFTEARTHANLADTIHKKNIEHHLHQYIPVDPTCCKRTLLTVRITFFNCGGISIGFCFSHRLADMASFMAFLDAWAATCRGKLDFLQYSFDLANHFPDRYIPDHAKFIPSFDPNVVMKRFIFNEETVKVLKREATSPLVTNPTKVEAVSAFIWKHLIEVAKSKPSKASPKIFLATQSVNLRKRSKPPHSLDNVFGNCFVLSAARCDTISTDVSNQYHVLVSRMRNAIAKISKDYIVKARSGDILLNDLNETFSMAMKGESTEMYAFSSWCKFGMYEINFGWGNPVWVCTTALPAMNSIILMDSSCGKGIEAWINIGKDKLERLDAKIKLVASDVRVMD